MKTKIKNLLSFAGSAWRGGFRGKIGLLLALFAIFVIIRMFVGVRTVQGFVIDSVRLAQEHKQLQAEHEKLNQIGRRIHLIQRHSPDYIEELSQQHLNLGDPRVRILK